MENTWVEELAINKFKLEDEAVSQAGLYGYYADKLADSKTAKKKAENRLSYLKAKVELELRKNPPEDCGKVTEGVIKSLVLVDTRIKKAEDKLLNCEKEYNALSAVVSEFEQRGSQIKVLKDLYCANYYAMPNFNKNEEATGEIRKNLNKNKEKNNG